MFSVLRKWRGQATAPGPAADAPPRQLKLPQMPPLTYVVGDLHGMCALYRKLEAHIQDAARAAGQPALIVLVGDLVDRGPDSAGLLDLLMARAPDGLRRMVLMGNHEEMFLQFVEAPRAHRTWLEFGGRETLASYGIYGDPAQGFDLPERRLRQMIEASIPSEHINWLRPLPQALHLGETYFVSHSGLDPSKPLAAQTGRDLMWSRRMDAPPPEGVTVIHGHTPVGAVDLTGPYIDVDTGAYATGRLSAVRLVPGEAPSLVEVT